MRAPHATLLAVSLTACMGASTAFGQPLAEALPLVKETNVTLSDTALNGTALTNSSISVNATMPILNATAPLLINATSIVTTVNETAANILKEDTTVKKEETAEKKEGWFKRTIGKLFGASSVGISSSTGSGSFSARLGDTNAWQPSTSSVSSRDDTPSDSRGSFDYTPSYSRGSLNHTPSYSRGNANSRLSSMGPSYSSVGHHSSGSSSLGRHSSGFSSKYYDDDHQDEEDRRAERKRRRSDRKARRQPRAWRKKTPWHTTLVKTTGPSDAFGSVFEKRQWMADPNDGYRKYLTVYDDFHKRTTYYDGGSDRVMGTSTINFWGAEEARIVDPDGIIYTAEPTSTMSKTSQRKLENKELHDVAWI